MPRDVDESSINAGGQCEAGFKMILLIGDVPLPTSPTLTTTDSEIPGIGSKCMCMYI